VFAAVRSCADMFTVAMAVKQVVYMAAECQARQGNMQALVFGLSLGCNDYVRRSASTV
jgi:hypothetical protein